jgi:hypothetical protein
MQGNSGNGGGLPSLFVDIPASPLQPMSTTPLSPPPVCVALSFLVVCQPRPVIAIVMYTGVTAAAALHVGGRAGMLAPAQAGGLGAEGGRGAEGAWEHTQSAVSEAADTKRRGGRAPVTHVGTIARHGRAGNMVRIGWKGEKAGPHSRAAAGR